MTSRNRPAPADRPAGTARRAHRFDPPEVLEDRLLLNGADPYEPNETPAAAFNLSAQEAVWLSDLQGQAVAEAAGDVDWYKLTVPAGRPVVKLYFQTSGAAGAVQVSLLDAAGAQVYGTATAAVPAEDPAAAPQAGLSVMVPAAGTYTVRVEGPGVTTPYDMRWEAADRPDDDAAEPNDSLSASTDLTGDDGRWLSQTWGHGVQYDEDWYSFYVPRGRLRVSVDLRFSNARGNLRMSLWGLAGQSLTTADTQNDNEVIAYLVTQPGWYSLVVNGPGTGTPYDLKWDVLPTTDPYLGNHTRADAFDLSDYPDQPLTGIDGWGIIVGAEQDFYRIDVPDDRRLVRLSLETTAQGIPLELALIDAGGVQLTNSTNGTLVRTVSAGGTYYIRVDRVNDSNVPAPNSAYSLQWSALADEDAYEENDSLAEAYDLSAFEGLSLLDVEGLAVQRDVDFYRLTVQPGRVMVVRGLFQAGSGSISLELQDAAGNVLASSTAAPDGARLVADVSDLPAGTCYLRVSGVDTGNVYDLMYVTLAEDDLFDLAGGGNDTPELATDLRDFEGLYLGYFGASAMAADEDWYTVGVSEGSTRLAVWVDNEIRQPIEVSLYTLDGELLVAANDFDGHADLTYAGPPAGAYRLRVQSSSPMVPYDLLWDAAEPAGRITIGAGGVSALSYTDPDGTAVVITASGGPVSLELSGGGAQQQRRGGTIVLAGWNTALDRIDLSEASTLTRLTITTDRGGDGLATVGKITGDQPIAALTAPTLDVLGGGIVMTDAGGIERLVLHDLVGGVVIMPSTNWVTGVSITAGALDDVTLIATGSPIAALTLGEWSSLDGVLTGPGVTRLTVRGRPADLYRGTPALAGDLRADLFLTWADQAGRAIGRATIAGRAIGTWTLVSDVIGGVGTIRINSPGSDWNLDAPDSRVTRVWLAGDLVRNILNAGRIDSLTIMGDMTDAWLAAIRIDRLTVRGDVTGSTVEAWIPYNVCVLGDFISSAVIVPEGSGPPAPTGRVPVMVSFRAGRVSDAEVQVEGGIRSISVVDWLEPDGIDAETEIIGHWIDSVVTRGAPGIAGDFEADLTTLPNDVRVISVRGDYSATLLVSGLNQESGSRIPVLGSFRAASVRDSSMAVAGGVGSFSVAQWLDADEEADLLRVEWITRLVTRGGTGMAGSFEADVSAMNGTATIYSLNVRGWLATSDVQAKAIGSVVVGGARDSSIFAGTILKRDGAPVGGTADGVPDLPTVQDIWTAAALPSGGGRLNSLVVTGLVSEGGLSFINTNIGAVSAGTVVIRRPNEAAADMPFGLAADSITRLSCLTSEGWHAWPPLLAPPPAPILIGQKMEVRIA